MSRIGYTIKQAFQQIWRNRGMTLASIFAITAMMLILGLFFVMIVNLNLFTEMIKGEYDVIEVYLEDTVSEKDSKAMMDTIETFGGVKEIKYRTKDEALKILKNRWGENAYLLDSLGDNPLPNSILITVDSLDSANNVYDQAKELKGVEDISFFQETVDKLLRFSKLMQYGTLVVMAFLVIVSIVVVSNTIKLTVLARAREISIMKYIGATNWFIRGPFLVEGIVIGIISSCLSAGIVYLLYRKVVEMSGRELLVLLGIPPVPATYLAVNMVIIFLAMGVSIGAAGSVVSMRKYLDR